MIKSVNWKPGDELTPLVRQLNQQKINLYAEAVADNNPIHVDRDFAVKAGFKGTIAHGMLLLAYISEMMTNVFGESWFATGKLAIRFKSPALSTDLVTITGKINSVIEENDYIDYNCSVNCYNQDQSILVAGDASVKMKLNAGGRI
jgi:acyl dehydratase